MRALTWQGKRERRASRRCRTRSSSEPTDAIIRVTSTAICGSDLHLYEVLGPYLHPGDILGHEPMGIVEEVGAEVTHIKPGRPRGRAVQHLLRALLDVRARPVRPVRDDPGPRAGQGRRAVRLHRALRVGAGRPGRVPAGARRPTSGRSRCPTAPPDERFLYLSDILPTAWQAVALRRRPGGRHAGGVRPRPGRASSRARIAMHPAPARHRRRPGARAAASWRAQHGVETARPQRARRRRRGGPRARPTAAAPDGVIERSGWRPTAPPVTQAAQKAVGLLPDADRQADDRQRSASTGSTRCTTAIKARPARRHGVGQRRLRRRGRPDADDGDVRPRHHDADGPGHVKRWIDDIVPAGHRGRRPARGSRPGHPPACRSRRRRQAYEMFQEKADGCIKVVLKP